MASVTASEEYLATLCARAFLRLWSYPNLYRDQGQARTREGKELCDLLVVFGDDVLLFSDKHCQINTERDLSITWRRWYRDAVIASARQIAGAERWLVQHPTRVFLDRKCSRPFPIRLPEHPKVHRIVTCRGAAAAARTAWGGRGSLFVTSDLLADCLERPFTLGSVDERGAFVHVFDEVALDLVLTTLDTAPDFCDYLTKRERFFRRCKVVAAGEEDLLGFYLRNTINEHSHDFVIDPPDLNMVAIDDSFWSEWERSPQRAAKQAADAVSYCWDKLIEKFSFHMIGGTQYFATDGGVREGEILLRWMARESRFDRRMLAEALLEVVYGTEPGKLRRRYIPPRSEGDPYWVFLSLSHPENIPYAN